MSIGNSRPNVLTFQHVPLDDGSASLRPVIDGSDLLARHRNGRGVDPDRLLPPLASSLSPTRRAHRAVVGSCACGDTGCGSLSLQIRRHGGQVTWGPAETGVRETISQTFCFELEAYLDAVDDAAADRPGEGQGRRVARAATSLLREYADVMGDEPHRPPGIDWVHGFPYDSPAINACLAVGEQQHLYEIHPLPAETDERMVQRVLDQLNDEVLVLLERQQAGH